MSDGSHVPLLLDRRVRFRADGRWRGGIDIQTQLLLKQVLGWKRKPRVRSEGFTGTGVYLPVVERLVWRPPTLPAACGSLRGRHRDRRYSQVLPRLTLVRRKRNRDRTTMS